MGCMPMRKMMNSIPLSLYIHIPWCVKKCPYCDFNSHTLRDEIPEVAYVRALLEDFQQELPQIQGRVIQSVFIGGGTPSLFSPDSLETLLVGIQELTPIAADAEITLEANPGTVEQNRFSGFKKAGINRLSLGVQSFQSDKLRALGRIHDDQQAIDAVEALKNVGFLNFNLDLMYGLPGQSLEDVLNDLNIALTFDPPHLSWYQLTLEPNTPFFRKPPPLPADDAIWTYQQQGQALLLAHGFPPYEISAYAKMGSQDFRSRHNLNYWKFGDYLGIGAGAHGKITHEQTGVVTRTWKLPHPKAYLEARGSRMGGQRYLTEQDICFEFMLNALRLYEPVSYEYFVQSTGLDLLLIKPALEKARQDGFLEPENQSGEAIKTTPLGKRYLNDLLTLFLD